jgi:hypothetical protein
MTDQEILQRLQQQLQDNSKIGLTEKKIYDDLVTKFFEEGFQIEIPDNSLKEPEEQALRELALLGYLKLNYGHHAYGWGYRIDLRAYHYHALKNPDRTTPFNQPQPQVENVNEFETFSTGAVRDSSEGKIRPDLISPLAMERLAEWLRLGAKKYSERNWEKGFPLSRTTASLYRHLLKFQQGATDEDHVAAIMCNAMMIAHTQEMVKRGVLPESLLDMPDYATLLVHGNKDEPFDY